MSEQTPILEEEETHTGTTRVGAWCFVCFFTCSDFWADKSSFTVDAHAVYPAQKFHLFCGAAHRPAAKGADTKEQKPSGKKGLGGGPQGECPSC